MKPMHNFTREGDCRRCGMKDNGVALFCNPEGESASDLPDVSRELDTPECVPAGSPALDALLHPTPMRSLVSILPDGGAIQAMCLESDGSLSMWQWRGAEGWLLHSSLVGIPLTGPLSEHMKGEESND